MLSESAFCAGIKIVNSLPLNHTSVRKETAKFKVELNTFLNKQLFYFVDELWCLKTMDGNKFRQYINYF